MQRAVTVKSAKHCKSTKHRFSQLALALALSVGTFGGMLGFASMTEPAQAAGGKDVQSTAASSTTPAPATKAAPERPQPRVVRINGFANCAAVKQIAGTNGKPGEFRCERTM